jgi:integrase
MEEILELQHKSQNETKELAQRLGVKGSLFPPMVNLLSLGGEEKKRASSGPARIVSERMTAAQQHSLFQVAEGDATTPPTVTSCPGRIFEKVDLAMMEMGSETANNIMTLDTRKRQLAALKSFKRDLTPSEALLSLPLAILSVYERRMKQLHWLPQTMYRELANIIGAFQKLPLYANVKQGYELADTKVFKQSMHYWKQRANATQPVNQVAATAMDVARAVELEEERSVKVALMMSWLFAGRVADVSYLKGADVVFWRKETGELRVRFAKTKTTQSTSGVEPYTLTTCVPPEWHELLQQQITDNLLRRSGGDDALFPRAVKKLAARVTDALRRVNPALGARTLRRGALQLLAKDGRCDLEEVRKFAGHKDVATTLRYLNWGAKADGEQRKSFEAAVVLGQGVTELAKRRAEVAEMRTMNGEETTQQQKQQQKDAESEQKPKPKPKPKPKQGNSGTHQGGKQAPERRGASGGPA